MAISCKGCGTPYDKVAFYSGITTHCRPCWRAKVKETRERNKEYYLRYDRARADRPDRVAARAAYRATERGKARLNEGSKRWVAKNPEKRKAQIIVGNALRSGKLLRSPCEVCGSIRVTGHHDDYGRPLSVRWLCVKHHAEHHKKLRNLETHP